MLHCVVTLRIVLLKCRNVVLSVAVIFYFNTSTGLWHLAGIDTDCNMNNSTSGLPSPSSDCLQFEQSANSIRCCDITVHGQRGLCTRGLQFTEKMPYSMTFLFLVYGHLWDENLDRRNTLLAEQMSQFVADFLNDASVTVLCKFCSTSTCAMQSAVLVTADLSICPDLSICLVLVFCPEECGLQCQVAQWQHRVSKITGHACYVS